MFDDSNNHIQHQEQFSTGLWVIGLRILNPICFIATLLLTSFMNLNENHLREFPVLLYPAQFSFYIWFGVYALQGLFALYSAIPSSESLKRNYKLVFEDINFLFALNWLSLGGWTLLTHYENIYTKPFQLVALLVTLVTQFIIYAKANPYFKNRQLNLVESLTLRFGGSIYLGWLFIMFALNSAFLLYYYVFKNDQGKFQIHEDRGGACKEGHDRRGRLG